MIEFNLNPIGFIFMLWPLIPFLISACYADKKKLNKTIFYLLGIFCFLNIFIFLTPIRIVDESNTAFINVYHATTPYGFFSIEGYIHGSGTVLGFSIDGKITNSEYYSIKYYKSDSVIGTMILDATETDLIVDGTLRLELSSKTKIMYSLYGMWIKREIETIYRLHIPNLPEVG